MSILLRSVLYVALAGLAGLGAYRAANLWVFGPLAGEAERLAREQARAERLDGVLGSLQGRCERKRQALEALLDGRLTFDETVRQFQNAEQGGPDEPRAREALSWAESLAADDPRAAKALPRVRAEFEARFRPLSHARRKASSSPSP